MKQNALSKDMQWLKKSAAGTMQAKGKSTAKNAEANMAELHRGLMALDSELSGKYKKAAVQLLNLMPTPALNGTVGLNLQIDNAINRLKTQQLQTGML